MKKRVLAIAMSLAMTLSLLPVSVLAAETGETPEEETPQSISTNELSEPAENTDITVDVYFDPGVTVVVGSSSSGNNASTISEAIKGGATDIALGEDVTEDVTIPEGRTVTIDLAGYTLTNKTTEHTIANHGTLTVEDSSADGTGKVTNTANSHAAVANYPGATVDLVAGTYEDNSWYTIKNLGTMEIHSRVTVQRTDNNSSMIDNGWYGNTGNDLGLSYPKDADTRVELVIDGGTFSGGMNTIKNDDFGVLRIHDGTFSNTTEPVVLNWNEATIYGGTFTINAADMPVVSNGYLDDDADKGQLTIAGGTFTAGSNGTGALFGYPLGYKQGGVLAIEGGQFTGTIPSSGLPYDIVISRGGFSSRVPNDYLAPNHECTGNDENGYTVQRMENKLVVTPEVTEDGSVSSTLEGTFGGSNTTIEDNNTGSAVSGDDVTIDLTTTGAGTEITTATLSVTAETAQSLDNAGSLTVKTNVGTVELNGTALEKVSNTQNDVSITVTKNTVTERVAASYTVEVKSGNTDLLPDGGSGNGTITLTLPVPAESKDTTLYVWYAVEQGSSVMYVNRVATYSSGSGTAVTFDVSHLSRYDLLSANPTTTAVASITNDNGTQYYESLRDAINQVGENETITLIKNIPNAVGISVSSGKKFTVDFNGFTYTLTGPGAGSTNTETNGFQLLKDSTITFKNGTIRIAKNANNIKRIIQNYADLTLENMQFYAQNQVGGEAYALSFNNGDITFKGNTSIHTTRDDTIAFDVCKFSNYPSAKVTFDNSYTGTVNGRILYDSSNAETHSLIIKGNGQFGGISKTSGSAVIPNITVTGGTFANSVADIAKTPTYEVDKNTGSYPYSYTDKYAEAIENAGPGGEVSIADKTGISSVYKVTFVYGDNRNNTTSEVVSDTTVTLPDAYRIGYTFNGWRSSADNNLHKAGTSVTITANTTFTADWTRNQTDRPSGGGSSSSDSGDYLISVDRVSGGRVTVQPGRADKGDTVTITVYPNDGYELDELVVTDSRGNEIDLDARSATRFTFTMPSGKVTVEASFIREGGQTQTPQTTFADVPASAWYYDAVEYVYENGLMSGVSGGRFAPNDTLTRAMLVQTLYAMEGRPAAASAGFADVASGDWYASAVNWAAANGVVSGVSETGFGPNNALTREQLALILYRFAQYKGYDVTGTSDLAAYADGSSVSGWAAEAMSWAVNAGLISGVGGNQIAPTGTATRAQVAQILMNFCENVAH